MQHSRSSDSTDNFRNLSINSGPVMSSSIWAGSDDDFSDNSPLKRQKCFSANRDLYRLSILNSTIQNGSYPIQTIWSRGINGGESYQRIDQDSSLYVSETSNNPMRLSVRQTYPLVPQEYVQQPPAPQFIFRHDTQTQPGRIQRYNYIFNNSGVGFVRSNSGRSLLDYQAEREILRDHIPLESHAIRSTCLDILSATRMPLQPIIPIPTANPLLRRSWPNENAHRRQQVLESISHW